MCDSESIRRDNRKHASAADFCHIFTKDLKCFYKLAFLLTGNHSGAHQCVISALEDALEQHSVHLQWAQQWSKRAVIKRAVQTVFADPPLSNKTRENWHEEEHGSLASGAINAVARMASLERFVYVLSVLERFSDRECSILLGCALHDLTAARIRALSDLPTFHTISVRHFEEMHIPQQLSDEQFGRSRESLVGADTQIADALAIRKGRD